jgi:hypothetical protein
MSKFRRIFCSPLRRKNRLIVELYNYFCNKKGGQKNKQVGCLFITNPLIIDLAIISNRLTLYSTQKTALSFNPIRQFKPIKNDEKNLK